MPVKTDGAPLKQEVLSQKGNALVRDIAQELIINEGVHRMTAYATAKDFLKKFKSAYKVTED